ncbi:MAG: acetyl-CoA acetyltransferase [Actinobacteria bacterium]|nr:acetyl-CoA acetyltransferase [Actinomycetota bacterium]
MTDPRGPVLVGVGMVEQREEDPRDAVEALELMVRATQRAGDDSGAPELLKRIDWIVTPRGQARYGDPCRAIGRVVGSPDATTTVARVGILQQTIIGDACRRIAEGEIDVAVVVGGEARYRALRGRILGVETPETEDNAMPDHLLEFDGQLVLPSEYEGGLGAMPVGYYALIESALRAAQGLTVDDHRDRVAGLYSRFSEIAATNPHAWRRQPVTAEEIRDASARNPMLAFPYTKLHNSSWNVDQATALLLCSAGAAAAAGVDRSRWIFPLASAESNHALALSERPQLADVPGVRVAGQRAFEAAGVTAGDLDLVELYSCFPVAVQTHAREMGIGDDVDWTVTGGMPFAGGPFNSYVLQSTGRMGELLRERASGVGVVSSVSGLLTKHGVAVWSSAPGTRPFALLDVTREVDRSVTACPVVTEANGAGTILGCTVVYEGEGRHGVAIVDVPDTGHCLARTDDGAVIEELETVECVGRPARVVGQQFALR